MEKNNTRQSCKDKFHHLEPEEEEIAPSQFPMVFSQDAPGTNTELQDGN